MKTAVAAFVLLSAILITVFAHAAIARNRAEKLLQELKLFSSSENFNETFSAFRQRYGKELKARDGCSQQYCAWEITVSEHPKPVSFWLPNTELSALFQGANGGVDLVLINYTTRYRNRTSPVVHLQINQCWQHPCKRLFGVSPRDPSKDLWNGLVEWNPTATTVEREAALSLNFDCFGVMRECRDITEMLPSIWGAAPLR